MKSELTVERILYTRARCGHELRVRSVGPAILLVIERDAPLRMEMLSNTFSEDNALREWLTSSPGLASVGNAFTPFFSQPHASDPSSVFFRRAG